MGRQDTRAPSVQRVIEEPHQPFKILRVKVVQRDGMIVARRVAARTQDFAEGWHRPHQVKAMHAKKTIAGLHYNLSDEATRSRTTEDTYANDDVA